MNTDDYFDALLSELLSNTDGNEMMSTSDDEKPLIPWTELPCIAIEKIYSYLSKEDQFSMSMVCRNWNKEYSSPSLWRKFKFIFPENDLTSDVCPEVQFARKYGDMFHHVEIECRWVRYSLIELIVKQLKLFLQALTFHSQLETVAFIQMEEYFRHLDDTMFDDVYQSIKDFFLSQHKLKTVEFRNAQFKKLEAAEILRLIFLNNSKSLQNMQLNAFVDESDDDEEVTENVVDEAITFESFLNLKKLEIDYSQFFENIIITLFEYAQNLDTRRLKGNLELIKIFCDGSRRIIYQGIPPECWKFFVKICPFLKISLTFQIKSQIRNSINLFVVRYMPLKVLEFKWQRCQVGSETEIGVLFQHLQSCRSTEYLEELSIVWLKNMNNLAPDLVNFLQNCKKLRMLQLYVEHPIESLDIIFISWLETRPSSLQNVCITVGNIRSPEDVAIYSNMADDYCPLLQIHGLNLLLIVDSDIRPRLAS